MAFEKLSLVWQQQSKNLPNLGAHNQVWCHRMLHKHVKRNISLTLANDIFINQAIESLL